MSEDIINKRKEDSYQMGRLAAKVDSLSDALKAHMLSEEKEAERFKDDTKRLNKHTYFLIAAALLQAATNPTTASIFGDILKGFI